MDGFLVDPSETNNRRWSSAIQLLAEFPCGHLTFRFQPSKKQQAKRKFINRTLVFAKSTTLNPMVKLDLVTSRGETISFLFLQATTMTDIAIIFDFPQMAMMVRDC